MAIEPLPSRFSLPSGVDIGPSDFALASRLYYAILYREGAISGETITALFRAALASGDACFVGRNQRVALQGIWADLLAEAETQRQLVSYRRMNSASGTNGANEHPDHIGVLLVFHEEVLGFIGVAGRADGYSPEAIGRFSDLAALLAEILYARFSQDQRIRSLASNESEIRLQSQMLAQIRDSVVTMDLDGYIVGWNRGAERLFGYTAEEIIGKNILLLYADSDKDDPLLFNAFLENGSHEMTVRRRKKSGEIFWASVSLSLAQDDLGQPTGLIGYVVDISERLAAEQKLRLHSKIFESSSEAIVVTDAAENIISANQAFTTITGYVESEVLGKRADILAAIEDQTLLAAEFRNRSKNASQWSGQLQFRRKNGVGFPAWASISSMQDSHGAIGHYLLVFSDISERQEVERQNFRLAYYDTLTGLPNRALFYARLEQVLSQAHRNRSHGALLLLDLNRFKNVNDSFGHTAADALLKEVGRRLSITLRKEDVISRLGGDEFVIALLDIKHREHAGHVAQKLLTILAEPFHVDHHEVLLSASIGISLLPEDGHDTETLLKHADTAMFLAKKLGNSTHVFYSQEMNPHSFELLKLEGNLRRAIERSEFHLNYQPQLDLSRNCITGAEALLRWNHPEQGLISPAQFIPIAEETGLIIPIGEWVIDAACRQIRAWRDQGLPPIRVAVNLSARQFSAALPKTILDIIARHGIANDALELEITESMLMHNPDSVVAMMREFGEAGILMALDDFGTGYSSLSYLKRFPIDNLKIDQSFVRGIPDDQDDSAIARAIIGMAKNLRLSVVAEGVETAEQMAFLREAGCDEIQGYYFSRPIPADELATLLVAIK